MTATNIIDGIITITIESLLNWDSKNDLPPEPPSSHATGRSRLRPIVLFYHFWLPESHLAIPHQVTFQLTPAPISATYCLFTYSFTIIMSCSDKKAMLLHSSWYPTSISVVKRNTDSTRFSPAVTDLSTNHPQIGFSSGIQIIIDFLGGVKIDHTTIQTNYRLKFSALIVRVPGAIPLVPLSLGTLSVVISSGTKYTLARTVSWSGLKMSLNFYYDLMSQPSRAIYIFLKLNGIEFEPKLVILEKFEQKTEEFKKLNPLGEVPIIDDNGFILRESVGILRYLSREKNVPDHWYPKESKAQARLDEFIEWQHLGLRLPCMFFFRLQFLEPKITGKAPLESEIQRFRTWMLASCDTMENIWLNNNNKFLFGDQLTIADLLAVMELEQPKMCGYDPGEGRPRLKAYMDAVKSETSPYYDEANKIIDKIAAISKLK